jgi:hypothetical protein
MNQPRKGPFHLSKQATQHESLPGLQGDGDKGIEIVYGFYRAILEKPGRTKIACTDTTSLTNKEGPISWTL